MNERIIELALQAGLQLGTVLENYTTPIKTITMEQRKFAELIVKECAEQIKTQGISASSEGYGDYEIGFNAGLFHALHTTKEHFGVE